MAFTAKDLMERASLILKDVDAVRWTLPEHLIWINEGVRQIILHKPTAGSSHVEIQLAEGVEQQIGAEDISLIRVVRNLAAAGATPRAGGAAITPCTRASMDNLIPGWTDPTVLPYATAVAHVVQDMADPRTFFVVPGNDGDGVIEAIVSRFPAPIAPPPNPDQIASYAAPVPIPDAYQSAMLDWLCFRTFGKDQDIPATAQRAGAHYQAFAQAIGLKAQADATLNVHAPEG